MAKLLDLLKPISDKEIQKLLDAKRELVKANPMWKAFLEKDIPAIVKIWKEHPEDTMIYESPEELITTARRMSQDTNGHPVFIIAMPARNTNRFPYGFRMTTGYEHDIGENDVIIKAFVLGREVSVNWEPPERL